MQLAVDTVVFGPRDPVNGGVRRVVPPADGPSQLPRYVGARAGGREPLDLFQSVARRSTAVATDGQDRVLSRRLLAGQPRPRG